MASLFGLLLRAFFGSPRRARRGGFRAPRNRPLSPSPITSGQASAQVLWVLDGDTVDVDLQGCRVRVRLDAIDCPEDGQPWGDTAKAGLIKMIARRTVTLEIHGIDCHGRTLATIFVRHGPEGKLTNVNERMVMLGHAWVYHGYCAHLPEERQRQLHRLEDWARSKNVGLWRTPDPVPPWNWRRGA